LKGSGLVHDLFFRAKTGVKMLVKTIKKRAKNVDFESKNSLFITIGTKAFNWTAKVSIILSQKNCFARILANNLTS
jgi:hypothetical protein